ncbi:hypothetical protein LY78DRAFT_490804 [Colletotrichum sublineola]|nr:hypothetical protein LY78DRAFT_490804 [Colletotrichum sublineola]
MTSVAARNGRSGTPSSPTWCGWHGYLWRTGGVWKRRIRIEMNYACMYVEQPSGTEVAGAAAVRKDKTKREKANRAGGIGVQEKEEQKMMVETPLSVFCGLVLSPIILVDGPGMGLLRG